LKFTFNNPDNIYISPYDGSTYSFPDQCWFTERAKGSVVEDINTYSKWETFYEMKANSFGFNVGLGYGGFTVGVAFQQAKGKITGYMKNNTRTLSLDNRIVSLYQLDLFPINQSSVSTLLKNSFASLPRDYQSNKAAYLNFIQSWGTHYITASQFGAKVNTTVVFESSLYNKFGSKWVSQQVGLSIGYQQFRVGINTGTFNNKSKVDETFKQNSFSFLEYAGGIVDVFESSGYKAWLATIPQNPILIMEKTTLEPINKLATDATIRENLRIACAEYIATGKVAFANKKRNILKNKL